MCKILFFATGSLALICILCLLFSYSSSLSLFNILLFTLISSSFFLTGYFIEKNDFSIESINLIFPFLASLASFLLFFKNIYIDVRKKEPSIVPVVIRAPIIDKSNKVILGANSLIDCLVDDLKFKYLKEQKGFIFIDIHKDQLNSKLFNSNIDNYEEYNKFIRSIFIKWYSHRFIPLWISRRYSFEIAGSSSGFYDQLSDEKIQFNIDFFDEYLDEKSRLILPPNTKVYFFDIKDSRPELVFETPYSKLSIKFSYTFVQPQNHPMLKDARIIYEAYERSNIYESIKLVTVHVEMEQSLRPEFKYSKRTNLEEMWFQTIIEKFNNDFSWKELEQDIVISNNFYKKD